MRREERRPESVYLVQGVYGGPIKIGRARVAEVRLRQIQLMSPVGLRLLLTIAGGGGGLEKNLHRLFDPWRLHGEWFRNDEDLVRYFASMIAFSEEYRNDRSAVEGFIADALRSPEDPRPPRAADDRPGFLEPWPEPWRLSGLPGDFAHLLAPGVLSDPYSIQEHQMVAEGLNLVKDALKGPDVVSIRDPVTDKHDGCEPAPGDRQPHRCLDLKTLLPSNLVPQPGSPLYFGPPPEEPWPPVKP